MSKRADRERLEREALINAYEKMTKARAELVREHWHSWKEILARFAQADRRVVAQLRKYEEKGSDELALFRWQITEPFEVDELRDVFRDFIEQIDDDIRSVRELRQESTAIDNGEDEYDDDDDDTEEE